MGYTCNKPAGSCTTCDHFRFDEDKQDNACFATVDAFAEGADYELAFYKQVDVFKKMCGLPSDAIGIAIRAKNGYTDDWGLPEYSVITVNLPGPFGEPELIGMVNCAYMDINNSGRLSDNLRPHSKSISHNRSIYRRMLSNTLLWARLPVQYLFMNGLVRTLPR